MIRGSIDILSREEKSWRGPRLGVGQNVVPSEIYGKLSRRAMFIVDLLPPNPILKPNDSPGNCNPSPLNILFTAFALWQS